MSREKKPAVKLQRQTHWDPVAKWYNGWVGKRGSVYHRSAAIPTVLALAAIKTGERVLDIGCGQGVLAPHVLKKGAAYRGVDGSRTLVQLARKHHGDAHRGEKPLFFMGDARKLHDVKGLEPQAADVAIFMLSIQDMDPLHEVLLSASWALKPNGRLIIFMLHPAFRVPRQSGWGFDKGRKLTYRRIDSYLSSMGVPMKAYAEVTTRSSGTTWSFHRPLSVYINTLNDLGFVLERFEELPAPDVETPHAKESAEIPLFCALRVRKLPLS